ncbi:hypothetical protein QVD17_07208 [Tagetes erecta]|uniref:Uncharacterized protein n=1 Tax=Tagetes erecta TaxID=13708 RepID=A0AAD8LHD9_TARER|nr:hypothetical protein QVD17_07208 [Tagetes erecta]
MLASQPSSISIVKSPSLSAASILIVLMKRIELSQLRCVVVLDSSLDCTFASLGFAFGSNSGVFAVQIRCTSGHHHTIMQILIWFLLLNGLQEVYPVY